MRVLVRQKDSTFESENENENDSIYKLSNYGPKTVRVGGPDGSILGTYDFFIEPSDHIRAPSNLLFYDKKYRRIIKDDMQIELSEEKKIEIFRWTASGGMFIVPELGEGIWTMTIESTHYLSKQFKFIKSSLFPRKNSIESLHLNYQMTPECMISPKAPIVKVPPGNSKKNVVAVTIF
jgi:hypothetical protein